MSRLCKSLKEELLLFTDALEDIFDDKGIQSSDIAFVRVFMMQLTPQEAMAYVIEKILPWTKQIVEKNEEFFHLNREIFGKLPPESVNYFANLLKGDTFTQEDKDEIWAFFATFVTYGEEYKKNK